MWFSFRFFGQIYKDIGGKKYNYKIIDSIDSTVNNDKLNKFLNKLKKEDLDKINGLKAIKLLYELREIIEKC